MLCQTVEWQSMGTILRKSEIWSVCCCRSWTSWEVVVRSKIARLTKNWIYILDVELQRGRRSLQGKGGRSMDVGVRRGMQGKKRGSHVQRKKACAEGERIIYSTKENWFVCSLYGTSHIASCWRWSFALFKIDLSSMSVFFSKISYTP